MGRVRQLFSRGHTLQLIVIAGLGVLLGAAPSRAQDASELLRLLHDSQSFRVRTRAVLALAAHHDPRTPAALEAALLDEHVAVRAAAATALGHIGSRRSLSALRRAASDDDPLVAEQVKTALRQIAARELIARAVPAAEPESDRRSERSALAHVRYAVVIGETRNRAAQPDHALTGWLGERIAAELRALGGFAVFSHAEMTEAVAAEIGRNRIPLFRIEGNITRLDARVVDDEQRMHCEVSLLLMDEPARNLRGLIKGAATSSELSRGRPADELSRKAVRSAVRSAMANALQATEAAARERMPEAHADVTPSTARERRRTRGR